MLLLLLLCILSTAAVVIDTTTYATAADTATTPADGCSETGPDVLEEPAPTSIQLILDWPR